jgi:hypothetical protein
LFVSVPIVAELPTPAPPIARTAPVALPPWIVAAALLVRLVIVAPGPFETPTPPAACEFPIPAPPRIVPLLVSVPIMLELETP